MLKFINHHSCRSLDRHVGEFFGYSRERMISNKPIYGEYYSPLVCRRYFSLSGDKFKKFKVVTVFEEDGTYEQVEM